MICCKMAERLVKLGPPVGTGIIPVGTTVEIVLEMGGMAMEGRALPMMDATIAEAALGTATPVKVGMGGPRWLRQTWGAVGRGMETGRLKGG